VPAPSAHHLALLVSDLEGAEAFYQGLLGLELVQRHPLPGGGLRSVWLRLGDALLMLERADPAQPRRGPEGGGWHLLALAIPPDERAAWETRLAEAGVPLTGASEFSLYFSDPEGNRLALSHWPAPARAL